MMFIQHFSILRGFASLQPTKSLTWPWDIPTAETHDFLLRSVLLDRHFLSYPPSRQYQRGFWKWAIENMEREISASQSENDEFEIDERIYEHYLGLLPAHEPVIGSSNPDNRSHICGRGLPLDQDSPSESYVTHYWPLTFQYLLEGSVDLTQYRTVTLFESRRLIESGTTGLRTWRASFVLAQHLTRYPDIVNSKRVLEVGCGVGFLGIVVAALQIQGEGHDPGSLHLTDSNDAVLSRCRDNFRLPCNLSSHHPDFHIQNLDWFASLDDGRLDTFGSLIHNNIRPDVLIGADIVFDPSLIPALVGVLRCTFMGTDGDGRDSGRCALIALTRRNEVTIEAFVAQVREASLFIKEISIDPKETLEPLDSLPDERNVSIFRISAQEAIGDTYKGIPNNRFEYLAWGMPASPIDVREVINFLDKF